MSMTTLQMCDECGDTGWSVHGSAPNKDWSNVFPCQACKCNGVEAKPKPDFLQGYKRPSLANSGEIMEEPLTAKPCPFCGGTVEVESDLYFREIEGYKWGAVVCACCEAQGPSVRTGYASWKIWRESALKEWNQRA